MGNMMRTFIGCLMMLSLSSGICHASDMLNYCMAPPFLQAGILPNLLFIIDNSASMFDLAYTDTGLKHCSNSAAVCTTDADCGAGTCSVFDRVPMYCYDETYKSTNEYIGYYNRLKSDSTKQYYNYDFTITSPAIPKFDPVDAFSCTAGASETALSINNELCVIYNPSLASSTKVTKFLASGNYLNWLTASKFDIQKQILTGGRYSTTERQLLPESRGCVGQGFIKQPLTADFVNFSGTAANDTNTSLKVTFRVHGPTNTNNPTAPSLGGGTRIDIFIGNDTYNYKACQDAVASIASGTNAAIKQDVAACLSTTALTPGYCKLNNTQACSTSTECKYNTGFADTAFVCSLNSAQTCSGLTDVTSCAPVAQNVCQNKQSRSCTIGNNASCDVTTAEVIGTCGTTSTYSPILPNNLKSRASAACRTASDCTFSDTQGHITTTYTSACSGYTAASTTNYGPCVNLSPNYGSCIANYYGECVLPSSTVASKTKVAFQQSLQACWALRNNGTAIGHDEYNTVINQCPDVYGGVANGPYSIQQGNYALLCGINYEGQMYSQSAAGQPWLLRTSLPTPVPSACSSGDSVEACMLKIHTAFCNDTSVSNVTDPTDDPSNTTLYGNIPAILSGIGVEAQLGQPLAPDVHARVALGNTDPVPTGLIQDFSSKIRMGVMSFNYDGSLSEATAMSGSKYCSNNTSTTCTTNSNCPTGGVCTSMAPVKVCSNTTTLNPPTKCTADIDCGSGNTCVNATNRDGGQILSYISKGHCSATAATNCAKDAHCPSGETCVYEGVGDHTTGLIKTLDDIKAATWTPFAEAFYNAIGYFAVNKSRDATAYKYSRASTTDAANNLRLNANDFVDNMNPVQYSCQQNNILVVSDGMSTMDQNSTVNALAVRYHAPSNQTGACPTQFGSKNLDDLAYLAKNYNINEFTLASGTVSTPSTTLKSSEFINTYVVLNGETNGLTSTDECNSETLLSRTATDSGTSLYKAVNQSLLKSSLKTALDDISAKVSSGTAAAVANNKSGERGANIIQALFYPKWPSDFSKKWMGDIQALWFYVDPIVKFSGIYEDTVKDFQLNLASDRAPGNDSLTVKALWKAGELLHARAAADRKIYTLLDSTQVLTNAANEFNVSTAAKRTALKPLMDMATLTNAQVDEVINYVRGSDGSSGTLRSRKVTNNGVTNMEWKLGDVINSTPQIQGNDPQNKYDIEYGDASYGQFTKSSSYRSNNYVYAGSNDGMLHAFKLGLVSTIKDPNNPFKIAQISDTTDIGKEMWAYIPKNVLPYLKNCSDPNYCHQFLVDGAPLLFDASINKHSECSPNNYWDCPRQTKFSSNILDEAKTSWRSILLGSMGLGGATRNLGVACNPTSAAGPNDKCINTPIDGVGYSSYFALDVTTPVTPTLLWEFSDASIDADTSLSAAEKTAVKGLGLTTPGGIQIRVNSRKTAAPTKSDKTTNGRWFAVFPSGPTGPIDTGTHQFLGQSDQNLKIYIVDLNPANGAVSGSSNGTPAFTLCKSAGATGCNYWVKDTNIKYAFANSLFNAAIDIDKGEGGSESNYSDDIVYITYTKASLDSSASPGPYPTAWDKGGVLRLITNNDPDPYNWFTSKLIDDIGPVTRSVDMLQDKNNKKLWVFFGEARYFFRQDDLNTTRRIFGVADPCYSYDFNFVNKLSNTIDKCPAVTVANLNDQSGTPDQPTSTEKGWYINLDPANVSTGVGAERLSGGISTRTNGLVLFTTFIPSLDPCDAGGLPSQWAVNYKTGGAASPEGKVVITTSDSPIAKTISLAGAFTQRDGRKLDASLSASLKGMPPPSPPPSLILPSPAKRILHIQER